MPKKNVIKKSALTPTVLIAGGAGFIGSHLSETLLNKGARVVVLDNFNTGKDIHVKHLLTNPNFALFNVDINFGIPQEIESVDYIFHFAGLEEYLYNKNLVNLDSLLTNALGTKNLLDLATKSGAKMLLASSIDVYEGRMSQLQISNYFGKTTFDENKYSMTEAKRFAEALVWEYQKKNNTDLRIARLPEVYGPKMNLESSGSLGGFLKQLIEGNNITIYGDGTNKEFYLYIDDAVSGIIKALFTKETKNNIYSLVPAQPYSALELAYLVKSLADRSIEIKFRESFDDIRPHPFIPDTYNLRDLDWDARIDMKQGVKQTLQWFGYKSNENSFKPSIYIENKIDSQKSQPLFDQNEAEKAEEKNTEVKTEKTEEDTGLFTLSDVKEDTLPTATEISQISEVKSIETIVPPPVVEPAPAINITDQSESVAPEILHDIDKQVNPITATITTTSADIPTVVSPAPGVRITTQAEKTINWPKINVNRSSVLKTPVSIIKFIFKPHVLAALSILGSAIMIFLALPAFSFYKYTKVSLDSLQKLSVYAVQLDSKNLALESQKANDNIQQARRSLYSMRWAFKITGNNDFFNSTDKLFGSLEYFSKVGTYVSKVVSPYESLWDVVKPDSQTAIDEQKFKDAQLAVSNAQNYLELAYADYNQVKPEHLPKKVSDVLPKYSYYLSLTKDSLSVLNGVSQNLPEVLGTTSKKRYMIIFQNSNEIRPTGGFVGSYGIVDFDKGKIVNLLIDDIYNPDGQLDVKEITIAPPDPIKQYLNENKLYMRNANWNPDFPETSRIIEDLYNKATGDKVDGVIAIDLNFVQKLLDVTGPVFLTAYNEEISSQNVFERAEYHSEFNYQNGSDQKRSFLTLLGGKLLERLFSISKQDLPNLLTKLQESLESKHLMFYLDNSPLSILLQERKWNGELVNVEGDYLYIVNANLGGTKANYYVKNAYEYNIVSKTRDGILRAELQMDYEHTGRDDSWPGGPYTNYVRVLTQTGTRLTGASIKQRDVEEEDIFNDVVVSSVGRYTSYEYVVTVNPKEKVSLFLKYDLPERLNIKKDSGNYIFYWQKQPGTQDDKFKYTFSPPFGMQVVQKSEQLNIDGEKLTTNGMINTDLNYFISLR